MCIFSASEAGVCVLPCLPGREEHSLTGREKHTSASLAGKNTHQPQEHTPASLAGKNTHPSLTGREEHTPASLTGREDSTHTD